MRLWTLSLALFFVPLGLALAGARTDDDEKKEEKKADDPIAGTWKAVTYEQQGNKLEEAPDYVLTFKNGKYAQKNNGMEDETGSYKLTLDKTPHLIDLTIETGNDKGKKQPGIFKVKGDKLTWCLALPGKDKRPEKFETDEEGGMLVEFKRVKEEKDKEKDKDKDKAFGLALAFADDDKKEDKKADPLVGTWKVTKFETDGAAADIGEASLGFKDGKYTVTMGGMEVETGSYKIDADKKPATLDFDIKTGSDKGKKQPGLFKAKGDKLTICLAKPGEDKRPEKIESGDGFVYAELTKAKE